MEAILKFTLPDEESEHRMALDALSFFSALSDFGEQLRARRKWGFPETVKTIDDAYDEMAATFYEILTQHNVDLDR